ncbi:MAG: hypothetical protein QM594_11300 [Niabella sp.]
MFRELYANQQADEVVYIEENDTIVIGFRKMLLTLDQDNFKELLNRFDEITNDPLVWEDKRVKSVMVDMPCTGLQILFTENEACHFYSLLLNAYIMV